MEERIAVVAYPGAQLAAVYGLLDLLRAGGLDAVHVTAVQLPELSLAALVLPPSLDSAWVASPAGLAPELGPWLRRRRGEGAVLCSVCVAAFLLAEQGLLDRRPATTHWRYAARFRERYPSVALDTDRRLIDDGDVITAAGVMGWVELGLSLIARFCGPSAAVQTARSFVVDPGGLEQGLWPVFSHGDEAVLRTQRWLQARLSERSTVAEMAAYAGLGQRSFMRRFQKATGLKTSAYIQLLRVARARSLLETSDRPLQEVAWAVGYEDVGAFRRVFSRLTGLSPRDYRRRFLSPRRLT